MCKIAARWNPGFHPSHSGFSPLPHGTAATREPLGRAKHPVQALLGPGNILYRHSVRFERIEVSASGTGFSGVGYSDATKCISPTPLRTVGNERGSLKPRSWPGALAGAHGWEILRPSSVTQAGIYRHFEWQPGPAWTHSTCPARPPQDGLGGRKTRVRSSMQWRNERRRGGRTKEMPKTRRKGSPLTPDAAAAVRCHHIRI